MAYYVSGRCDEYLTGALATAITTLPSARRELCVCYKRRTIAYNADSFPLKNPRGFAVNICVMVTGFAGSKNVNFPCGTRIIITF